MRNSKLFQSTCFGKYQRINSPRAPVFIVIVDSTVVSIFVVILVELTNTVFVNSTNISTNIETAVLSNLEMDIVV